MNYTIVSQTGQVEKAATIQEAHEKAVAIKHDWQTVARDIIVKVFYYDGTLVEQL